MIDKGRPIPALLGLTLLLLIPAPLAPATITVAGTCTLNAAIRAANTDAVSGDCPAGSGPDTIVLTDNVFLTTIDPDHSADGPNGLPSVTSKVTIEGNGFDVFRDFISGPEFRIFHVSANGDLTLDGVRVAFGHADEDSEPAGAGIFNAGRLVVRNSNVTLNRIEGGHSSRGGGILGATNSTTSVFASRITNNTLSGGTYVRGAGIALDDGAVLTVEATELDNNSATSELGRAYGAAISAGALVTGDYGTLTLASSTVSNNEVEGDWYVYGAVQGKYLAISNTTISGNTATSNGWGGSTATAGVHGAGTIDHSTFHGNVANGGSEAAVFGEDYGFTATPQPGLILSSTLFASSTGDHCRGSIIDGGGGNLDDDDSCLVQFGTLTGLDSTLQLNGGPTKTHALLDGSSAIDPNTATCAGLGTDQRGAARVAPCDSGAFEHTGVGCTLFVISDTTMAAPFGHTSCHTTLLGPDLVVQSVFDIGAPHLISLTDGVRIDAGAYVRLSVSP